VRKVENENSLGNLLMDFSFFGPDSDIPLNFAYS